MRWAIDDALAKKSQNFEAFIRFVEEQGYTAKRGKHLKFTAKNDIRGTRCNTLKGDYTEDSILAIPLIAPAEIDKEKGRR